MADDSRERGARVVSTRRARRADTREDIVDAAARAEAQAWVFACRGALIEDGRSVSGGWPGTLTEARARASHVVGRALARRSQPALTNAELGTVARLTYREARAAWIRVVGRGDEG